MADENENTHTHRQRSSSGDNTADILRLERQVDQLKTSLRAVTSERDKWKNEFNTSTERFKDYDAVKAERDKLQTSLSNFKADTAHRLALADAGVKGKRARRMLMREYTEEHADVAADARPQMAEWLKTVADDPVLSAFLPKPAAASDEGGDKGKGAAPKEAPKSKPKPKPKPKGTGADPNAGADQPPPNERQELTLEAYRKDQARSGGRVQGDALKARKEQLRAAGIIK